MVFDEQHRQLEALAQRTNQRADRADLLMVQAARRLIEQEQLRLGGERPCELDALLRAERQRGDRRFGEALELEQREELPRLVPGFTVRANRARQPQRVGEE